MAVVLVVVAVLLGLAAVLAVPVDVAFRLEGIEAFQGRITIRWLFGLVRVRIRLPRAGKPPAKPRAEPKAAKKTRRPGRRGRRNVLAVAGQAAFRRRVHRLVRRLVQALHPRQVRLRLRFGTGDPAETGRLWAVLGPLDAMARNLRAAEVRIEPEFLDPVLELHAQGRLSVVPLQILAPAVAFALSPPSIRAWRTLRGGHA